MATLNHERATDLLRSAVNDPGIVSTAFSQFHNYSFLNILSAACQCASRGIAFGPIATYPTWQRLGRQVRKGEKAITLCQPVPMKRKADATDPDSADVTFTHFTWRPRWFVLSQTEGADVPATSLPAFEMAAALAELQITERPFALINGNVGGYAQGRTIAINPVNPMPHHTRFHEVAHILLGHTTDGDATSRALRELEAEAVALLCSDALGLGGAEQSRGYIQGWWGAGNAVPEASAIKIFKTADAILRAGRARQPEAEQIIAQAAA